MVSFNPLRQGKNKVGGVNHNRKFTPVYMIYEMADDGNMVRRVCSALWIFFSFCCCLFSLYSYTVKLTFVLDACLIPPLFILLPEK